MRININERLNSYNASIKGKTITTEYGCQGRVELFENSLKSKFCSLKNKGAIGVLALPRATATTLSLVVLSSLAFFADRFVSVAKTMANPQASVSQKVRKVLYLPGKLLVGTVGLGIGVAFSPLVLLGYTIQSLCMMKTSVKNVASQSAILNRKKLLQKLGM